MKFICFATLIYTIFAILNEFDIKTKDLKVKLLKCETENKKISNKLLIKEIIDG